SLMKDAAQLYADMGVPFQPHWFPIFQALKRRSPLAPGEIARQLGLTHPAISQAAAQMLHAGLIRPSRDRHDSRRRLLTISLKGRRTLERLEPIWEEVRRAAGELLEEADVDLLRDLTRVEQALSRSSVMARVRRRCGMPQRELRIVDYRPAYKKRFRALNEEWLSTYFTIEEHDARVLNDPNRIILRRGGAILFAQLNGGIVGTCALLKHPGGMVELSKMAVEPQARGRGIGTALALAAIDKARAMGTDRLFLRTSPRLKEALRLYRRLGFRKLRTDPLPCPLYHRCSLTMTLDLRVGGSAKDRPRAAPRRPGGTKASASHRRRAVSLQPEQA
ncbi:MAG: helix-turn-helix domain-containing GNAT family N-acetyltransferase, partial [Candidatus Eisenbacteria bacterium]